MKKICIVCLILILIVSVLIACLINIENDISKNLGIDISSGTISNIKDTYGGFHNDGQLFTQITFADDTNTLENEIKNNDLWKETPLQESLNILIYGFDNDIESIGPFISDEEGNSLFPIIKNGYYFFKDRHSESQNPNDYSEVLNRNSFNFSIAIYDKDTKTIYYAKLDT